MRPSKAFVLNFTEALHVETREHRRLGRRSQPGPVPDRVAGRRRLRERRPPVSAARQPGAGRAGSNRSGRERQTRDHPRPDGPPQHACHAGATELAQATGHDPDVPAAGIGAVCQCWPASGERKSSMARTQGARIVDAIRATEDEARRRLAAARTERALVDGALAAMAAKEPTLALSRQSANPRLHLMQVRAQTPLVRLHADQPHLDLPDRGLEPALRIGQG